MSLIYKLKKHQLHESTTITYDLKFEACSLHNYKVFYHCYMPWVSKCRLRFPRIENGLEQTSQLYGFNPVWTRLWVSSALGRLKTLLQMWHFKTWLSKRSNIALVNNYIFFKQTFLKLKTKILKTVLIVVRRTHL